MNGEYILSSTPKGTPGLFPTQYHKYPRGVEYFEVYSPEITSLYSQVFWKGLEPVDLPKEVVRRYHGRGMAVVGFEMDQVIPGAGPGGSDVSVPITHAYNHHFESNMVGNKSTLEKVPTTEAHGAMAGHGTPRDYHYVVRELVPPKDARIPTSQAFGGANGGEYRKSFHGYAPGYAQIIDSPERFQITPMQIDTWHRDKMPPAGSPGASVFVPGPVPRNSLAPTSGPDAIYSGLLECPVTTRIKKRVEGEFVLRMTGGCGEGGNGASHESPITAASDCSRGANYSMGEGQCTFTVGSDATRPAGCSLTADANGRCHAFYNTLQPGDASACGGGGGAVAGARASLVDMLISLNASAATISLTGPTGVWFGVGVNASKMADAPWTLIVDGDGKVSERQLAEPHSPGSALPPSVSLVSTSVVGGKRTVVLTRPLKGSVFSFAPNATVLPFIAAYGNTPTLSYHQAKTPSSLTLLPVRVVRGEAKDGMLSSASSTPPPPGICICNGQSAPFGQSKGQLIYVPNASQPSDVGNGTVEFGNSCAPQPRTDMLAMQNPTCDLRNYSGGQTACHHMWSLLDADQAIPWPDQPLKYRLKFRFWAQPFDPDFHTNVIRTTWGIASYVEYDVPKCAPGMMGCALHADGRTWVHTITGTFGGRGKLVHAAFHCHAPTCLSVALYRCPANVSAAQCNASTPGLTLLCREEPIYGGTGRLDRKEFDEPGYILQPPCLWGDAKYGLETPPDVSGSLLHTIKTANATYGHHGEMAWQQMYYV